MKTVLLKARLVALVVVGTLLADHAVGQSDFPDRPVRFVVAAAAGGGTDIIARLVAQELGAKWNQSVVVENKTGAGGNIASQAVASSKADGYTVLITYSGAITVTPFVQSDMSVDVTKDLMPITNLTSTPMFIVVNPASTSVKTLGELLALAKRGPAPLAWGATLGGSDQLAGASFAMMAGIDTNYIPYKGGSQSIADLLGGRLAYVVTSITSASAYLKSGQLLPLAVTSADRSPMLPNVPTVAEAGVPGYQATTWFGMFVPAGTPPAIVKKISQDVRSVLTSESVKARAYAAGLEPIGNSPEDFARDIRKESAVYKDLINRIGLPKN